MANRKGTWKKGQSGNPKGRPPVLLPEVAQLVAKEKNTIKVLIIQVLGLTDIEFETNIKKNMTQTERVLYQCIDRMKIDGNMDAFRKLLEIVVGKLPEEKEPFDISDDEKLIIQEYRRRLEEENRARLTVADSSKPD